MNCTVLEEAFNYTTTDHLGSVRAVLDANMKVLEQNDYYPFGLRHQNASLKTTANRYRYNGKEEISATGTSDYGARQYSAEFCQWLQADPLAEKYYFWSPYNFCVGNPVKLVDVDGKESRLYVEVQGVGHVFVTTGSGDNLTVYTYGRYAELGKDKNSARSTSPTGEGVLIVLKGNEATQFITNQITEKNAAVFEFKDASDSKVDEFYMSKFDNSDKIPTTGKYKGNDNARIIDEYNLINNNCATTSVQSILYGGGGVSSIIGDNIPFMVAKDLHYEVAKEQNPISRFVRILLGDEPHIRLVPSEEILKETRNE